VRYWAIRHDGVPDGLIRQTADGSTFAYVDRAGEWRERAELLMKVREWNVDAIDVDEAELIAAFRGAQL
jgi:hypothetical protein